MNGKADRIESEIRKARAGQGVAGPEAFFSNGSFVPKKLADHLMGMFTFKTIKGNGMYVYDNGFYRKEGERRVEEAASALLGEMSNSHRVNETKSYIEYSTYMNQDDINSDPNLICMRNGIYDINKRELLPFDPGVFFVQQVPVSFDPDATCPAIMDFITQIVNKDDVNVVQEIIGFCLFKAYPVQKAFMFIGEGANGKSTLLNLIRAFLGKKNVSSVSLQDFDGNRFAASALYGKLANLYNDVSDKALHQTGRFKMLTGDDQITAEHKFKDGFQFVNYAKLLFSANKLPESRDDTDAFYRRWVFLNFPNKFEGDKVIPQAELLEKMTAETELSGLFNWAVEGLRRLLAAGRFSMSISTEENRDRYERLSSPIHAFVKDEAEQDPDAVTPKDMVYGAFASYCHRKGLPVMDKNVFSRKLQAVVPMLRSVQHTTNGRRERCYRGIKLFDNAQDEQDTHLFTHLNNTSS